MKPPVTYSHPKPVIAMIHMPFRSDGSSYAEVTSGARRLQRRGRTGGIQYPCPPILLNPYGQVWEHVSTLIRILKLSVCGSVKVRQSVDREYEREEYKTYTATCPFLHLQMCRSSNPLMETREETMKQAGPVHWQEQSWIVRFCHMVRRKTSAVRTVICRYLQLPATSFYLAMPARQARVCCYPGNFP